MIINSNTTERLNVKRSIKWRRSGEIKFVIRNIKVRTRPRTKGWKSNFIVPRHAGSANLATKIKINLRNGRGEKIWIKIKKQDSILRLERGTNITAIEIIKI